MLIDKLVQIPIYAYFALKNRQSLETISINYYTFIYIIKLKLSQNHRMQIITGIVLNCVPGFQECVRKLQFFFQGKRKGCFVNYIANIISIYLKQRYLTKRSEGILNGCEIVSIFIDIFYLCC